MGDSMEDDSMDNEVKQRIIYIHESVARTEEKTANIEKQLENLEDRLDDHEDEFQEAIEEVDRKAQENRDYIKKAMGAVSVVVTSVSIFGVYVLERLGKVL